MSEIRKNAASFDNFKKAWIKFFKDSDEKDFVSGKRGDYSRIWGFYDDYRTGSNISMKTYFKEIME
jgi:hypothetical protein